MEIFIRGVRIIIERLEDGHEAIDQFRRTLEVLPISHLSQVPPIRIGNTAGGSSNQDAYQIEGQREWLVASARGTDRRIADARRHHLRVVPIPRMIVIGRRRIDFSLRGNPNVPGSNGTWNPGNLNYTLLHEIGHHVDWHFGCMSWIEAHNETGFAALMAHPHEGETQGDGEHFGDAYADYFAHPQRLSDARRQALLSSPAFAYLTSS